MKTKLVAALAGALLAGALLAAWPAGADEKTPAAVKPAKTQAVPEGAAEEEAAPPAADPAFDRYVRLSAVADAVDAADAAALTDTALRLADGERVLLREHKSGLTAAGLAVKAAELAAANGDKESLERLRKAADRLGGDKLGGRLAALEKLASQARATDPALAVSVEGTTPEAFGEFKSCIVDLERARLLGDREALDQLGQEAARLPSLSGPQSEYLKGQIAVCRKDLPETRDETGLLLGRLGAASRGWSIANTPLDPGTYKDLDPTNKNSAISQAGGLANHLGDRFPTDGGTPGFVGQTPTVHNDPIKVHFTVNNKCSFPVRVTFEPGGQSFTFAGNRLTRNLTRTSFTGAQPSIHIVSTGENWALENANFQLYRGKDGRVHWSYE